MLANELTWSGIYMILDQWFKQILCVIYFTELFLGSFVNIPINNCRQYLLAILLGLFRDQYVTNQWNKSEKCVSSFDDLIRDTCGIWTVL